MKEGWDDQGSTELLITVGRATARERFSTSHISRNPLKLPEIVLEVQRVMACNCPIPAER